MLTTKGTQGMMKRRGKLELKETDKRTKKNKDRKGGNNKDKEETGSVSNSCNKKCGGATDNLEEAKELEASKEEMLSQEGGMQAAESEDQGEEEEIMQFRNKVGQLLLTYPAEKLPLPDSCVSEDEDANLSLDPSPVAMAFPQSKTEQEDDMENWTLVASKKKEKAVGKAPVVAGRQSGRLSLKEDGLSIQMRAEQRALKKNDITGMLNGFHVLNSVPNARLVEIARDSTVILGDADDVINRQVNVFKAKELAEAVLASTRATVRREEEEAKAKKEEESKAERALEQAVGKGGSVETEPTPCSPLRSMERELEKELKLGELSPKLRTRARTARSGSSSSKKSGPGKKGRGGRKKKTR